jgi:hypothetical protein
MLRCRNCLREVPARALRLRPSRWRERLLLTVALAIPASLAVAVAFGSPTLTPAARRCACASMGS